MEYEVEKWVIKILKMASCLKLFYLIIDSRKKVRWRLWHYKKIFCFVGVSQIKIWQALIVYITKIRELIFLKENSELDLKKVKELFDMGKIEL